MADLFELAVGMPFPPLAVAKPFPESALYSQGLICFIQGIVAIQQFATVSALGGLQPVGRIPMVSPVGFSTYVVLFVDVEDVLASVLVMHGYPIIAKRILLRPYR